MIIGFFIIYSSIMSPIDIAFEYDGITGIILDTNENILLIFFILDIIMNLRTTYLNSNMDEVISW